MNTLQLSTEIVTRLNTAIENGESRLNQQAIVQGCIERELSKQPPPIPPPVPKESFSRKEVIYESYLTMISELSIFTEEIPQTIARHALHKAKEG